MGNESDDESDDEQQGTCAVDPDESPDEQVAGEDDADKGGDERAEVACGVYSGESSEFDCGSNAYSSMHFCRRSRVGGGDAEERASLVGQTPWPRESWRLCARGGCIRTTRSDFLYSEWSRIITDIVLLIAC